MRTGTADQIELLLLRHGATPSNAQGRYLGRTDEPLSEEGQQELLQKRNKYKELTPDVVFSGPMTRCRETAELLFKVQPVTIPEWTEINFGTFEMKNYHDLDGDPDYQAWIDSGGTLPFPGGESREDFICRSMEGLDRLLFLVSALRGTEPSLGDGRSGMEPSLGDGRSGTESSLGDGRRNSTDGVITAAAVVHGGTIMSIMSTLTGGEYFDFYAKNGEGYCLYLTTDETGRPVLSDYKST